MAGVRPETIFVDPADIPGSFGAAARGEAGDSTVRDIAGSLAPPPITPELPTAVTGDLARIQREEIAARGQLLSGIFGRSFEDQERVRHALEQEGVGPNELKPWDADAERRKYEYDPVQAFGSIGSVFVTIASAFTRRPMINALNSSAAAMEATREAKKEDFQRAYAAWKDNNDLVIKRHNMMHQQYQDAITLMQTNLQLGTAKLTALAAQFGDQRTLALLDHGMSKELFEMLDARNRAVESMAESSDKMAERLRKNFDLNQRLQQPGVTKQDIPRIIREWHRDWETQGYRTTEDQLLQDFRRDYAAEHDGKPPPAEEEAKFLQSVPHGRYGAGGGTGVHTPGRDEAEEIRRRTAEYEAAGMPHKDAYAKATKEVKTINTTITGNRREQLEAHIAQYGNAIDRIDKVMGVLDRYVGAAGIAGRVTRTGERVGNIFGNRQTDRVQFMRDVEYIKALAPNLLLDRSGRPLSAEAAHINDIVAGLSAGDTTANTQRAMRDLRALLRKMRTDQEKRIGEAPAEAETPSGAIPTGGSGDPGAAKPWYENYQ